MCAECEGGRESAWEDVEAKERMEEARLEARAIVRCVAEGAICRRLFETDGEMKDLRNGWYRLRSLGCRGGGLGVLVGRRGCDIINEVREASAEAYGELLFEEAIPPPKGTDWLDKAFKGSRIDEWLQIMAATKRRAEAKERRTGRPPTAEMRGGDA